MRFGFSFLKKKDHSAKDNGSDFTSNYLSQKYFDDCWLYVNISNGIKNGEKIQKIKQQAKKSKSS